MLCTSVLVCSSCTTTTTDNGYKMAESGNTKMTYYAMDKDSATVRSALLVSLQARKWQITSTEYPITAYINKGGQNAKVSITFKNGNIVIETVGSKIDDKAYVPIRYVDYLMKTVYKYLR